MSLSTYFSNITYKTSHIQQRSHTAIETKDLSFDFITGLTCTTFHIKRKICLSSIRNFYPLKIT